MCWPSSRAVRASWSTPVRTRWPGLEPLLAEHDCARSAVLLTHGHLDHTASAASSAGAVMDVPAFIHPDDEYMLDDPLAALSAGIAGGAGRDCRWAVCGRPTVLGLADLAEPDLAGLPLTIDHIPGHTGGSVVFRLAGDGDRPEILLTGDTLFAGSIGRTDLPGGSAARNWCRSATGLLTRPDDAVVLPGHGPSSTVGAESAGNPFLTAAALAQARHAEGRSART